MSTEEGWLSTPDGFKLYTKTWKSNSPTKARLAFVHGFSDHCNFYNRFYPDLTSQGISVYAFDQRGWGRSVQTPAQKGLTGGTQQVMDDISTFLRSIPQTDNNAPLFLMGHSMGGQEVLYYAATGPQEVLSTIRGVLTEAPFLGLHPSARPLPGVETLGRIAGRLLPHMHMMQKIDPVKVSRDVEVVKQLEADPLCHDTGTLEGLAGMLDRARALSEGKVTIKAGSGEGGKTRLWVSHGTGDLVCDYDSTRQWTERVEVEDKHMKTYDGWYHKLHDEPGECKDIYARDVAKWILDRSGEGSEVGKAKL